MSCFLVPGDLAGLSFGKPEEKMGLHAVPTTSAFYDHAHIEADRLIGAEGQGLQIAFSALDSGRLGIAAVAVGLAQAALDEATRYANERTTFGRKIIDHQGLGFVLADMAAAVASARATYLDAARRRDLGRAYSEQASIAKLVATDAAMKVTTDAVQVFGGVGYTRDYRVERYMREAKITQIFEGTNQIQRLVICPRACRLIELRVQRGNANPPPRKDGASLCSPTACAAPQATAPAATSQSPGCRSRSAS